MVETITHEIEELGGLIRQFEEGLSERQRMESRLAQIVEVNRRLVHEVNHRVRGNLQLMASLISLQSGTVGEKGDAALRKMALQIACMALVEDSYVKNCPSDEVSVDELFACLTRHFAQAYPELMSRIHWHVRGNGIRLDSCNAIALAFVSIELMDIAMRHAFPGGTCGRFELILSRIGESVYSLEATDNGVGISAWNSDGCRGMQLAEALASQLGGGIKIGSSQSGAGFKARMTWPIPN